MFEKEIISVIEPVEYQFDDKEWKYVSLNKKQLFVDYWICK